MSISKAHTARPSFAQRRVEAGVPSGGEFAKTLHSESPVVLGDGAAASGRLAEFTTPADLVAMTYSSAAYWQNFYRQKDKSNTMGLDDIAQEAVVQVLKHVQSGKPITNFRQLVNSVTANVTVRATANKFKAEDRLAYRILEKKRQRMTEEVGRSLTQKEDDVLAQEVLDEWHDDRHKPSKEFRTPWTVDRSLDATFGEDGGVESTLGATLVSPESSGHYIAPDSYMDRAMGALETTGAAKKAEARRLAWNAIAERAEVPLSRAGSLSQRQVTKHRGVIDKHDGGVLAACRDWSNNVDNEATAALFAPFGELSVDDQDKVVTMLERLGADKADDMWANALAFANNKHS
ncbi:hypothetical protein [Pseudarthrobacter sp. BIM B-2242]|uniref:hypothetical protein n=1 Tax=Pseudarthrobacter sp. BIM B-2242 TaxID=2772401 RepID=UPI00168B37A9|nr:hypothetical protein [Pseudarthrobacter sp. BIM B-2242]QOD05898.1 hypothetical protein IDT60_20220 [Pseudarthrobacter sp. BIM B-2242]